MDPISFACAQASGELAQQAVDFAKFFFPQVDQFIVKMNGFQGLDKHGCAAAAGTVNHAVHLAFPPRDHRHHKTIVTNGDEIFLQRAVLVMRPQEPRKRFFNQPSLLFGFPAQAAQSDTGVVGQRAVGKNLAAQLLCDFAEVGEGFAIGCETRVLVANAS